MITQVKWALVLAMTPAVVPAPIAGQGASDSIAAHQAHERWFSGLLAEDTVLVSNVLSADVTLGFPGGNVMPRSEFLAALQDGELFYDTADHEDVLLRLYRGTAVVTGRSTLTYRYRGNAGSEQLTYTAIYIRTDQRWRMVAWQSTTP